MRKKDSICSRDRPLVSGTQQPVNTRLTKQMAAKKKKGTWRPKALQRWCPSCSTPQPTGGPFHSLVGTQVLGPSKLMDSLWVACPPATPLGTTAGTG